MLLLIIIFLLVVIALALFYNLGKNTYSVPNESDFSPIKTKIDDNYILYDDDYILPYQYLDFTVPSHRWMYYYYPSYYSNYYNYSWPFPSSYWSGSRYSDQYHKHNNYDRKYSTDRSASYYRRSRSPSYSSNRSASYYRQSSPTRSNVTRKTPRYSPHRKN